MSRRWFLSWSRTGVATASIGVEGGRGFVKPLLNLTRRMGESSLTPDPFRGPNLSVLGPRDVAGLDRALVIREEPPPGTTNASEANLACVEFAHADLPWQLAIGPAAAGGKVQPWLALVVLREDECDPPRPADPLPVIDAPLRALPDLQHAWAWAHVEARLPDTEQDVARAVQDRLRQPDDAVISRLLCPRRLEGAAGWMACVVPATAAGRQAGLGQTVTEADPTRVAWPAEADPVELPVYHWWRFRTEESGSFEDLARRLERVPPDQLAGLGRRPVDVRHPWPFAPDLLGPIPESLTATVDVDGALRLPGPVRPEEWTDSEHQSRFRQVLREQLNAPAKRRGHGSAPPPADRTLEAVAPPLYGSHHTGEQTVPDAGWVDTVNLEVRRRVAAALGTRYVQLEQEFLVARAWEQIGEIRRANQLLAAGELSAVCGERAQRMHVEPLDPAPLVTMLAPLRNRVTLEVTAFTNADTGATAEPALRTLSAVLRSSNVPDGVASTAWLRLTRPTGALARRIARTSSDSTVGEPVVTDGLRGVQVLRQPASWLVATGSVSSDAGGAGAAPGSTLATLLAGQPQFVEQRLGADAMSMVATLVAPMRLRGVQADAPVDGTTDGQEPVELEMSGLHQALLDRIKPMPIQHRRLTYLLDTPAMTDHTMTDPRPLRPIMAHPHFPIPIGAELLSRWPDWAIPGIGDFPNNRVAVLETNPEFVEAVLVGLNQEINRELLWREFPTDQRGTPFARFWPRSDGSPEIGEIANWPLTDQLGTHSLTGGHNKVVLLVRGDVLRRFPGTLVLAAPVTTVDGVRRLAAEPAFQQPTFVLALDEATGLYGFDFGVDQALGRAGDGQGWFFVVREPMRGTQFGFDLSNTGFTGWADLTWEQVPTANGFVLPHPLNDMPPTPPAAPDLPVWGSDAADLARIAFQQPFQLVFFPEHLIPT